MMLQDVHIATISDRIVMSALKGRFSSIADRVAMEFPTQDALKTYLKKHPKSDKSKHTVKETRKDVPEQEEAKPTPSKGGFVIPKHKLIDVKAEGDLSNLKNWKVKNQLGNSVSKGGPKKGEYDAVGYVAINTAGDDIIPIGRGDEHQGGYEYLYKLQRDGIVKSAKNYITLFDGLNYPMYTTDDTETYAKAVKRFRELGGGNYPVVSRGCVTDMDEYVELGGKVPAKPDKPMKPGREILEGMDEVVKGLKGKDEGVFEKAGKLAKTIEIFSYYVSDPQKDFVEDVDKVAKAKDFDGLQKVVMAMQEKMVVRADEDNFNSLFGNDGTARKKIEGWKAKPSKEEKSGGLSTHAKESVDKFEETAKAAAEMVSNPMAEKRFKNNAKELIEHLKSSDMGIDDMLDKAEKDMDNDDMASLSEHLFAFNGVKNFLHNYLRELKKRGEKTDKYFGDVGVALEEFNRLGQI